MQLEAIEIQTGEQPAASIIVLHGLGADGNDFVPIARELDLSAVGPVRFVFPHAPVRPVTINAGYEMRAWYDILALEGERREDEQGLRASQALVSDLIAQERARGIDASRIVLMGFSQGGAMTLLTGLRHGERLAGLVGLSGYLPLAASTVAERSQANAGVPIFLAHGRMDPIIPFARAVASRDALAAMGYAVEWHDYPMEHSVCPEEIVDLERFLLRVLARPAAGPESFARHRTERCGHVLERLALGVDGPAPRERRGHQHQHRADRVADEDVGAAAGFDQRSRTAPAPRSRRRRCRWRRRSRSTARASRAGTPRSPSGRPSWPRPRPGRTPPTSTASGSTHRASPA